ncbi:MAG: hypothetical protein P1Q69_14610 [Candidatus Thorarchaeota archaeon]|nr:hypothetical protein [Candidatus Thorarchaeota archaeon]
MKTLQKIFIGLLLSLFLAQPLIVGASAQGQMQGPGHNMTPPVREDDGSVWINTDVISIMSSGAMPMLHFWFANDENGSYAKFLASYVTLIEFEDFNEDGAFQSDEVLYHAPLASYEWTLQTGSVVDGEGVTTEVWLKYTKGGSTAGGMMPGNPDMPGMGNQHFNGSDAISRFEDVTLQIWAHIYLNDYEGTVSDDSGVKAEYAVAGSSELKMDIEVGNFPFTSEDTKVAIETILREDQASNPQNQSQHMYQTREQFRNVSCTSNTDWSTPGGNETRFQRMNNTNIQQIDFVDVEGEVPSGFFKWVDTATITWPGGETEAVDVVASYVPTGTGLSVYFAYPHFDGGSLLHDPSIGVYEDQAPPSTPDNTYYLLLVGIGIVSVLAIAVAVKRRK